MTATDPKSVDKLRYSLRGHILTTWCEGLSPLGMDWKPIVISRAGSGLAVVAICEGLSPLG